MYSMGLHVLSSSVALNTLSDHATCSIVWSAVFVIVMYALSMPRELKKVTFVLSSQRRILRCSAGLCDGHVRRRHDVRRSRTMHRFRGCWRTGGLRWGTDHHPSMGGAWHWLRSRTQRPAEHRLHVASLPLESWAKLTLAQLHRSDCAFASGRKV